MEAENLSLLNSQFFTNVLQSSTALTLKLTPQNIDNDSCLSLMYYEWGVRSLLAIRTSNIENYKGIVFSRQNIKKK